MFVAAVFVLDMAGIVPLGLTGDTRDYDSPRLLHHVIDGKLDATLEIFKQITISAQLLRDPELAIQQIDSALAACLAHSGPNAATYGNMIVFD